MAFRTYKLLLDTARTEEALPPPAQTLDQGWQWRTGETWRTAGEGCSATPKKSFPFSLQQRTPQGAKQTKKPQHLHTLKPYFPNQDGDNPGKIPNNQLMHVAVFPIQGSSWLSYSLHPPISLHHLSSFFKSTQYFLNSQVLTGWGKKKRKKL